jgi:biotin carboxyl carrier protein
MENAIPSPEAGVVKEINVKVDDKVSTNQVLMVLE